MAEMPPGEPPAFVTSAAEMAMPNSVLSASGKTMVLEENSNTRGIRNISTGVNYRVVGDRIYGTDGSEYRIVGNTIYSNSGNYYTRSGMFLNSSDGRRCHKVGNLIRCD